MEGIHYLMAMGESKTVSDGTHTSVMSSCIHICTHTHMRVKNYLVVKAKHCMSDGTLVTSSCIHTYAYTYTDVGRNYLVGENKTSE